jgi:plastocyanin
MRDRRRRALTTAGMAMVLLVIALAVVSVVYVTSAQTTSSTLNNQAQQISTLDAELSRLNATLSGGTGGAGSNITLPVMNQQPSIRIIRETWYLSPSAHQDRFDPSFIVANQGDTVHLTFIDNDTVAHDFVLGSPYNIIVNATVPGLINDLTGQMFTTPAKNNSPGVVVQGSPGNVSATYSFKAIYSGIYEFVCTYHAEVGMIGYLVVLPNAGYTSTTTTTTTGAAPSSAAVNIVQGASADVSAKGYSPDNVTVVLGVNNTVVWTNNDISPHTVTANDGSFYSGAIAAGGSYSYTFTKPGVYEYHCTYHPWMIGTVTVKAGP